jgi:hypothetical protein
MGEMRNAYKVMVGKPERKRLLGRSRRRWGNNKRIDLMETEWECGLDSAGSWQGSMAGSFEHGNELFGIQRRWEIS